LVRVLIAGLAAMLISILVGPRFIAFLRRKEYGQTIREEGPEHHVTKQGTPIMGGLLTLGAATAQQAHEHGLAMLRELGGANLALGFLSAFLSAWIAVRGLVRMLARGGLWIFGWYRLALAALVALALVYGRLEA
jgi:UDP-N-acetylmuramyl pentapeptide phosphotransferase/UDP-N-acetylglucosamine-1-phosphate transferase